MQPARRALTLTKAAGTPLAYCRGCLAPSASVSASQHRVRAFSSTTPAPSAAAPAPAPPTAPAPAGIAPLTSRSLISVSGPDAAKYLHGVITANLTGDTHTQGFPAAFLTAQGRVLHDVFIYRDTANLSSAASPSPTDTFLIEVDASQADRLQRHIKRYKLRANFSVRLLPSVSIYQAWDDSSPPLSLPPSSLPKNTITLPDTRIPGNPGTLGTRIVTLDDAPPPSLPAVPAVSEDTYHLRRYLHGIPEGQSEILRETALPLESNLDLSGAIDFRKGCYVGQELTIRTKHRGVVRKRILPVVLYPDGGEAPQEVVYRPNVEEGLSAGMVKAETSIGRVGKKGRSAGKWFGGMGNVGLALCRLEIMTGLVLPGGEGRAGGWKEGDEFVVGVGEEGEREVRVKAFVPGWMRRSLGVEGEGSGQ